MYYFIKFYKIFFTQVRTMSEIIKHLLYEKIRIVTRNIANITNYSFFYFSLSEGRNKDT